MLLEKLLSNLAVHVEPFALCMVSHGWRLHLPGPPEALLHFVLHGHGVVRAPVGEGHSVAPCWLVIVPAGAIHSLESGAHVQNEHRVKAPSEGAPSYRLVAGSSEAPDLIVACGVVSVRFGQSLGLFDHLRELLTIDLSDKPQVSAVFQGILAEQSHPGPGSDAMNAALMTQCLVHMFRKLAGEGDARLPWLVALEDPRLGRAIDLILEDPARHHTVDTLADATSLSRSAFAERFTSAFGRSPISLLHHVRMQRAAQLLRQGSFSIDEVASRVGFSSRSHFSRAFKKHSGVSPAAFRSQ